jgi:hypothetical protein
MADGITLSDDQMALISGAVARVHTVATTMTMASHGGTSRQVQATDKPTPSAANYKAFEAVWNPVLHPPVFTPAPPTQLGPFTWSTSLGEVSVSMQVTLYETGGYDFSGQFHDAGALDYDDSAAFAVATTNAKNPSIFTFTHTGSVYGYITRTKDSLLGGAPSANDSWSDTGINPAIQEHWADLCEGYRWQTNAASNWDVGDLLTDVLAVIQVVGAAYTVYNVVGALA